MPASDFLHPPGILFYKASIICSKILCISGFFRFSERGLPSRSRKQCSRFTGAAKLSGRRIRQPRRRWKVGSRYRPLILITVIFTRSPYLRHAPIDRMGLQHRADDALGLHHIIPHPGLLQHIRPRLLKPADIIGMMHNPHLIGLVILYLMRVFHCLVPFYSENPPRQPISRRPRGKFIVFLILHLPL